MIHLAVLSVDLYLVVATEAADDASKLKADLIRLQSCSKSAEEMARELESSITLCDNILQKVQNADTEREQLVKHVIELNEQLKFYKQTGVPVCVCVCVHATVHVYDIV